MAFKRVNNVHRSCKCTTSYECKVSFSICAFAVEVTFEVVRVENKILKSSVPAKRNFCKCVKMKERTRIVLKNVAVCHNVVITLIRKCITKGKFSCQRSAFYKTFLTSDNFLKTSYALNSQNDLLCR